MRAINLQPGGNYREFNRVAGVLRVSATKKSNNAQKDAWREVFIGIVFNGTSAQNSATIELRRKERIKPSGVAGIPFLLSLTDREHVALYSWYLCSHLIRC